MKFRKEYDSIGSINVPVDKYWGASTQRSKKYFDIGDVLVRPKLIKSYRSKMTNFEKVGVFMKTFNQDVKDSSSLSTDKINSLRISLINEELEELKQAISEKNLTEVADALTDILYVTYGAGHAFGINLDKCLEEVQKSNMSKLGKDGKPIYNEFGKVMKGPDYFKPDLSKFIK